jgi:hypothetical protein
LGEEITGEIWLKEDELKDTEETSLPPIEHVEAHRDVVEVDLLAHPVHFTHLLLAAE